MSNPVFSHSNRVGPPSQKLLLFFGETCIRFIEKLAACLNAIPVGNTEGDKMEEEKGEEDPLKIAVGKALSAMIPNPLVIGQSIPECIFKSFDKVDMSKEGLAKMTGSVVDDRPIGVHAGRRFIALCNNIIVAASTEPAAAATPAAAPAQSKAKKAKKDAAATNSGAGAGAKIVLADHYYAQSMTVPLLVYAALAWLEEILQVSYSNLRWAIEQCRSRTSVRF